MLMMNLDQRDTEYGNEFGTVCRIDGGVRSGGKKKKNHAQ